MRPHSPSEFLEHNEQSNSLIYHANFIMELRKAFAEILPGELSRYCSIANYKNGKLVVFADNNAVAAKLKLLAAGIPQRLAGRLNQTSRQVTAVVIEVQPRPREPHASGKAITVSQEGARAVRDLSDQVSDLKLKEVLRSIASQARK